MTIPMFSILIQAWYKTSESFRILINYYPELYALRENGDNLGIISISDETYSDYTSVLITSQPMKFGVGNSFKVVQRMVLRAMVGQKVDTHAGFYYFGSYDLIN